MKKSENKPKFVKDMTKVQFEPVVKNFGDSSEYLYEFGVQKTNYDQTMPQKLDDLGKRIAQKVIQEKEKLKTIKC